VRSTRLISPSRNSSEIGVFALPAARDGRKHQSRGDLLDRDVPVVLGGGILANRHERLWAALESELRERTPHAIISHVAVTPLVGVAVLALESAGAASAAIELARSELTPS
jgi:hypothetical protein